VPVVESGLHVTSILNLSLTKLKSMTPNAWLTYAGTAMIRSPVASGLRSAFGMQRSDHGVESMGSLMMHLILEDRKYLSGLAQTEYQISQSLFKLSMKHSSVLINRRLRVAHFGFSDISMMPTKSYYLQ